jgi:hypothetical protein
MVGWLWALVVGMGWMMMGWSFMECRNMMMMMLVVVIGV